MSWKKLHSYTGPRSFSHFLLFFYLFFFSLLYYFPVSLLNDQNFYILCVISQNEQSTGWRQGDAASGPEDGNHKHDGDGNRGGHGGMPKAGFGCLFYPLLYPDI